MRFALIGAAGYVAPKHMQAMYETGNDLVAALDPHDSVGILDKYFPGCEFFTETERFDRHIEKLRREDNKVDYISICSPNYLHDAHCRLAMRVDADAICEKPLVLYPRNIDQLVEIEKESGKKIYVVLQLRLHPTLLDLKNTIGSGLHKVDIKYITPRGIWYHRSWKGNINKSGGLPANIGVHLFDMVVWLFGPVEDFTIKTKDNSKISGILWLERAKVNFLLSTDFDDLPKKHTSYRSIVIDGSPLRFDNSFTNLHTEVYKNILSGGGFGLKDAKPSIELIYKIRSS